MTAPDPIIALGRAFITDQEDHDELVDRWSRTLADRATYRDDRVRGIAGRELCKARRHRFPGLRGCHQCASDIAAAWGGREP